MDNSTYDADKNGARKTEDMWIYPRMINCIDAQSVGLWDLGFGVWRAVEYPFSGIQIIHLFMGLEDCW